AMNLIDGDVVDGIFVGADTRIPGLGHASGPVTLGFRAEDATITAPANGQVTAPVYSFEHLGDATLVSVRAGASLLAVKSGKDFRAQIGDPIGFGIAPGHCHLFDRRTGERLDRRAA